MYKKYAMQVNYGHGYWESEALFDTKEEAEKWAKKFEKHSVFPVRVDEVRVDERGFLW